jgi:hypothetical protein
MLKLSREKHSSLFDRSISDEKESQMNLMSQSVEFVDQVRFLSGDFLLER